MHLRTYNSILIFSCIFVLFLTSSWKFIVIFKQIPIISNFHGSTISMCNVPHKKLNFYINNFHFHVQQFNVECFIFKKRKSKNKNIKIVGDEKMAF
ncbi:hypothetical protein BDL97_07G121600 [Sphagnum fallax]|nr:hypothetical protein BDL97_07G121600 [Sphagnum fallax]